MSWLKMWPFYLFLLALAYDPSHAYAEMPVNGYEFWYDDFNGPAGSQPPKWQDRSQTPSLSSEFAYDAIGSYAILTPTADSSDRFKTTRSENITCNVTLFDTFEIRVPDTNNPAVTQWTLGLQDISGYPNNYILHKPSGATGTFAFDLPRDLGWDGIKTFYVEAKVTSFTADYIKIDYIRVFQNTTNERFYWREDFSGSAGSLVKNWWDEYKDSNFDAEIAYGPTGTQGRITLLGPGLFGKVISPGVYWNSGKHNLLTVQVTDISEGTDCEVDILHLGTYQHVTVGVMNQVGTYTFDVLNTPGWPWLSEELLAIQFWIRSDQIAKHVDLDHIRIHSLKIPIPTPTSTVTPTPDTTDFFPLGGYATPNPFLPATGQKVFFNFRFQDPAAAATIKIYNVRGRVVRTLKNPSRPEWDGRNEAGHLCEGGVYLYQIESGGPRVSGQVVLIK